MPRESKLQLPRSQWPNEDRRRWEDTFRPGDLFDEDKRGTHLSEATRNALRVSYAQYLRFIAENHGGLLIKPPEARLDRQLIAEYVGLLRRTNRDTSIATSLHHLRLALRLICPKEDWYWLLMITKRIAAAAPHKPKKFGQVSSDQLYLLGIELMDEAVAGAGDQRKMSKSTAMQYRDGLLIALLAVIAVRRRTVTALRIGGQLVRSGNLWGLDIPPEDVKGKRALEFTLSAGLSRRIDLYFKHFRRRIPGAERHTGLWPSNKVRPMSSDAIYSTVCKRTKKAFGFSVNLHRFRHAAGTLWSIEDPENIRGIKDLLGHASYEKTTETHYVMGQSRIAGRALANAIDAGIGKISTII
jgi:integrase/recombinase XerD